MKRLARWFVLLVLVVLAVWYLGRHGEMARALRRIAWPYLLVVAGLNLANKLLMAMQFRELCRAFGAELTFQEWFGLSVCNTMYNHLAPGHAGAAVRALYLKKAHRLPLAHFGAIVAGGNVLALIAAGLTGLLAGAVLLVSGAPGAARMLAVLTALLGITLAGAVGLAVGTRLVGLVPVEAVRRHLERASEGLRLYPRHMGMVGRVIGLRAVQVGTGGLGLFVCGRAVGLPISAPQAIVLHCLGAFSVLLPITPAGLGVREGIVTGGASLLGLPMELALLAALVVRAVHTLVTLVLGLAFSYSLLDGLKLARDGEQETTAEG